MKGKAAIWLIYWCYFPNALPLPLTASWLFYAVQMKLVKTETILASVTYSFIEPWGPYAIDGLGAVIPWFRDMFEELKQFFGSIPPKQ